MRTQEGRRGAERRVGGRRRKGNRGKDHRKR